MALFLNGGGSGEKTKDIYKVLKQTIDLSKPLLYVPFAMDKDRYSGCFDWISKELSDFNFPAIEMLISFDEFNDKNLSDYACIFIGGGNTYKLLKELKSSSAFEKIKEYIEDGGNVFGGSAGAILFGKSIDSCKHADPNSVNLFQTNSFNQVFGSYLGAHYTNKNPEKTKAAEEVYKELSYDATVIALPEECTLYISKKNASIVGTKDYYLFKKGKVIQETSNIKYTLDEFKRLLQTE